MFLYRDKHFKCKQRHQYCYKKGKKTRHRGRPASTQKGILAWPDVIYSSGGRTGRSLYACLA